ncbi:hypothetical protein ACMFMF_003532 [Clarireedia jacksonii]
MMDGNMEVVIPPQAEVPKYRDVLEGDSPVRELEKEREKAKKRARDTERENRLTPPNNSRAPATSPRRISAAGLEVGRFKEYIGQTALAATSPEREERNYIPSAAQTQTATATTTTTSKFPSPFEYLQYPNSQHLDSKNKNKSKNKTPPRLTAHTAADRSPDSDDGFWCVGVPETDEFQPPPPPPAVQCKLCCQRNVDTRAGTFGGEGWCSVCAAEFARAQNFEYGGSGSGSGSGSRLEGNTATTAAAAAAAVVDAERGGEMGIGQGGGSERRPRPDEILKTESTRSTDMREMRAATTPPGMDWPSRREVTGTGADSAAAGTGSGAIVRDDPSREWEWKPPVPPKNHLPIDAAGMEDYFAEKKPEVPEKRVVVKGLGGERKPRIVEGGEVVGRCRSQRVVVEGFEEGDGDGDADDAASREYHEWVVEGAREESRERLRVERERERERLRRRERESEREKEREREREKERERERDSGLFTFWKGGESTKEKEEKNRDSESYTFFNDSEDDGGRNKKKDRFGFGAWGSGS